MGTAITGYVGLGTAWQTAPRAPLYVAALVPPARLWGKSQSLPDAGPAHYEDKITATSAPGRAPTAPGLTLISARTMVPMNGIGTS